MIEKWIARVRGDMYAWGITSEMLSRELGISPQYLSAVFNGKKPSKTIKPRIIAAVKTIIDRSEKNEHCERT